MQKADNSPGIIRPAYINELLSFYFEHPNSLIFAGGTAIMTRGGDIDTGEYTYIIDCDRIEELKKIKRTERYLEIGALVSLSRILGIGIHVIPLALYTALSMTAVPTIRQLATIGGNIHVGSPFSGILTVLYAMDATLELRSLQRSMWISFSELIQKAEKQRFLIPRGYILTRIRIPVGTWNIQIFRKIARKKSQARGSLTFCGLAKTTKGILADIRLCFGSLGNQLFRHRGFEVGILGRKLPLTEKTISLIISELNQQITPVTDRYSTAEYRRATSIRLTRWFLEEVNQKLF